MIKDLLETAAPIEAPPMPGAFFGNQAALDDGNDSESLWDHHSPREVPFFKMALLDQLRHRPYHMVALEGPFDCFALTRDYSSQLYRSEGFLRNNGQCRINRLLFCLADGIFAYLENGEILVYAPTPQAASSAAASLLRYVKPLRPKNPGFNIIKFDVTGPQTELVPVERTCAVKSEELKLHYGEDFIAWEQSWIQHLCQRSSGITVFYGPPGCGKTSYLRALLSRMIDRFAFYYLPITEAAVLSSSSFVSFWARESRRCKGLQKIAILEDAEDLLLPRDEDSRAKVSNLLQIGDGFLGDYLKLHVIATTNATITRLDAAVVRPGRLMGMREFRRLNPSEAQRLAQTKGIALRQQPDYSLAEIYQGPQIDTSATVEKVVGFTQTK